MNQIKLLLLLAVMIGLAACQKDELVMPIPQDIENVSTSEEFSWSTGDIVTFRLEGLPSKVAYASTLTLTTPDGKILFTRLHSIQEDFSIELTVPSIHQNLEMTYGKMKKSLLIVNAVAEYSFIPGGNK